MNLIKLTDDQDQTHDGMQWGPGVRHEAESGEGPLCSKYWIHAYKDKYVAVLMNPIQGGFLKPHGWSAKGEEPIERAYDGKVGVKALTTLHRIALPRFTLNQHVAFGIFCALELPQRQKFKKWAEDWLDNVDRSETAALAMLETRRAMTRRAAAAAARRAAPWTVRETTARAVRETAAFAATHAAAVVEKPLNLPALARKAYAFERKEHQHA
ncbi:MAG: hypothetical protein ACE5IZ_01170 [Dehalococcoidia bacterium]